MLGMAICDALGASTEFQPYKKNGQGLIKNGFNDIHKAIENKRISPRNGAIGVWTDDASMGLAMAYGLMLN
jgi:ADP-ribosylglycohydrolase